MTFPARTANTLLTPLNASKLPPPNSKDTSAPPPEHQGPLHAPDADWASALLSRDTFHAKIAHLFIPHHLSNIIWASLTNVLNIQSGCEQLHTVFTQTPASEEYLLAIKSHKKNTAPGLTGFSYRHLKALPDDLHKATYEMLCSLWPTQHIPEYWKQRWLVPLPKTDELTSIEDLRPICLLEIFRKL
jgi:hypothetical protein